MRRKKAENKVTAGRPVSHLFSECSKICLRKCSCFFGMFFTFLLLSRDFVMSASCASKVRISVKFMRDLWRANLEAFISIIA